MARPRKDSNLDMDMIERMYKAGCTDKQVASALGVNERSITNWKEENEEFFLSLKRGKQEADRCVERSLFERATGYSHPDVHVSNFKGDVTVTPITKYYAPDTTACIFWLKNRDKENWREKPDENSDDNKGYNAEDAARALSKIFANVNSRKTTTST